MPAVHDPPKRVVRPPNEQAHSAAHTTRCPLIVLECHAGNNAASVYLWSEADPAITKVRLISAREATQTEIRHYEESR